MLPDDIDCTHMSTDSSKFDMQARAQSFGGPTQACSGLCCCDDRHAGMEETRPFVPTVADHPRHLPRLQLRPGGQAAPGKGPANGMGGGVGLGMGHSVASGTSLAEPGSGVSADTPGTLPWGQPGVIPPERYCVQFC